MKRNIVIATVAAAALIGGGTAVALADSGTGSARSSSAGAAGAAPASGKVASYHSDDRDDADEADRGHESVRTARVTLSDAAATALKAVPGTLSSIDLDDDARTAAWDAEILGKDGKWHEVTVDASSGTVLNQRVDRAETDDANDAGERTTLKKAEVSAVEAARKAATGGGTVTSVDLDDDHAPTWEVEVVKNHKEHDLTVDPQTGKVTRTASDDDRDGNEADDRDDD
ncbi:PepSY domain-containing protein [Streptomyces coffeae]|uniref:PepSY domain-containing protein n=1 Tax=Streptomyces coffeae TaxID=621382 RepID=A0ABS1NQD3_9ACTN|nr:PepSY domain-containing protein [Streptomyces coffeae]MBL1102223.1 PepSY domain-containing protein [Streptomyces coffeae]